MRTVVISIMHRACDTCTLTKGVDPDTKVGGGTSWCVTQPFPAGGLGGAVSPPAGSGGRAPEANRFWQNLSEINLKSGLFSVAVYTPNSDPISDVRFTGWYGAIIVWAALSVAVPNLLISGCSTSRMIATPIALVLY